ncbi:hypothetical protein COEREDRAFT_79204 [Coemansia reversa NRRL 1564]|uniref:Uncharacterized protein n=1 Tax=Coemansia reversa (strain ATCC 12441 / NRRL 1564) TaxID=763665 RepID=A0A2G5BJR8_COERN|nr:hypothetical protein COEREDRAFT_79204 [Coemansia reversa NRRL 1564]|eukprot:PIA19249.1 hypothetical protein COEREDRAFT_79204 [Coemansia reversa NRRL 1564]
MAGEKHVLQQQAAPADAIQSSSANGTAHNTFLHLRLEPFISSSLIEILDVLARPVPISASVPSTPPPTYEPPPPSYASPDIRSVASMSTLDLGVSATSIFVDSDRDSISIVTIDSCAYNDSVMMDRIGINGGSSVYSFGLSSNGSNSNISGGGGAPGLHSELVMSVIMYEFLARRPSLSRSPSRDTIMTSAGSH